MRARGRVARRGAVLAAAIFLGASLASGCSGSGAARSLLDQAFSRPIQSASVSVNLGLAVNGVSSLRQPVQLTLSGPYQSNGAKKLPSFSWSFSLAGSGRALSGTLISTGDDVYLGVSGQTYDVGADRVAQLNNQLSSQGGVTRSLKSYGIDPNAWVTDASDEGDAQVDGTATTHVRAGLDVGRMLHDLNKTIGAAGTTVGSQAPRPLSDAQIQAVQKAVQHPAFDVYVAKSDGTLRRVHLAFTFSVPPSSQQQFSGATGGSLNFSLDLANVGQPQQIQAPTSAQPLSSLLGQLHGLPSAPTTPSPSP